MSKNSSASGPVAFLTQDHRDCDARWAEVEAAVDAGEETTARRAFGAFDRAMRAHFSMEEEVVFPALENATGMRQGPTEVMRIEHRQMRGVLDQMGQAAKDGNLDELADQGDTLLMLIQQHNMKEEHILYPMAEDALAAAWTGLAGKLDRLYEEGQKEE